MVVLALAASSGASRLAFADDDAVAEAKRQARELANKGYEQYEAGQYAKAVQYFRDAEARFHAPTLLLMQGNAQVKSGHFVEAQVLYQRVIDEQLPPDSPKEFKDAQAEARNNIDSLTGRIATLRILIKGVPPEKVRLIIDEVEVPSSKNTQPMPQNPGTHKIMAALGGDTEGGRAVFQSVNLKEGTTRTVQFVFRAGGPVTVETPPSERGCGCEVGAASDGSGAPLGAFAAAALGIAVALRRRRRA